MSSGMAATSSVGASCATPSASGATQSRAKLTAAAREFESVLLGQWLQNAESTFGSVPGGDENEDPGGDQMQSFATQRLAAQLAASGGIGIARLVQNGLIKASEHEQGGPSTSAAGVAAAAESIASRQRAASAELTYAAGAKP